MHKANGLEGREPFLGVEGGEGRGVEYVHTVLHVIKLRFYCCYQWLCIIRVCTIGSCPKWPLSRLRFISTISDKTDVYIGYMWGGKR